MNKINGTTGIWTRRVVLLSLFLFFFTVPHTLEDFALGMPASAGIPAPILTLVISIIFSLQAIGLFWIGQGRRQGLFVEAGIGLFWPIASGTAQLPTILSGVPYRSGLISIIYVIGMILVGLSLLTCAVISLRNGKRN